MFGLMDKLGKLKRTLPLQLLNKYLRRKPCKSRCLHRCQRDIGYMMMRLQMRNFRLDRKNMRLLRLLKKMCLQRMGYRSMCCLASTLLACIVCNLQDKAHIPKHSCYMQ